MATSESRRLRRGGQPEAIRLALKATEALLRSLPIRSEGVEGPVLLREKWSNGECQYVLSYQPPDHENPSEFEGLVVEERSAADGSVAAVDAIGFAPEDIQKAAFDALPKFLKMIVGPKGPRSRKKRS